MPKRKIFVKVEKKLTKIERKLDDRGSAIIPIDLAIPAVTAVIFPKYGNLGYRARFDFGRWYGIGIDQITYICQRQIERFLDTHDGDRSTASIISYCDAGLSQFLNFCSAIAKTKERDLVLGDINRDLIDAYLNALNSGKTSSNTQRIHYKNTKAVLVALGRRGVIMIEARGDNATFPRNPFPQSNRKCKGEKPLHSIQRKAFAQAVKTAVMQLFNSDIEVTSELLSYALLVIALHTGRNTTPLLEMTVDCLRPHPKENVKLLVLNKRRGSTTQRTPVRERKSIESTPTVWPGIVRLIERVKDLTSSFRSDAPAYLIDRLWIYRSQRSTKSTVQREVVALSTGTLATAIKKLVDKYGLINPDGKPLRINISILRQTFANRMFELLDGDLAATASATGNTPTIVGNHYMKPGENAEKLWKFMGNVMHEELLSGNLGKTEKTPTGGCSDNIKGQFAPKNGANCMNFLDCIRCRNFVVTGEDLYRLFSFYWLIIKEKSRVDKRKWQRKYAHIVRLIDRDVIEAGLKKKVFRQDQIEKARERARVSPHPFWTTPDTIEAFQ